jgi:hypothetical protein
MASHYATYLSISDDAVLDEPFFGQWSMDVGPVVVELLF